MKSEIAIQWENEFLSPAFNMASKNAKKSWLDAFKEIGEDYNLSRLQIDAQISNQKLTNQFVSNLLLVFIIFTSVILVFSGELQVGGLIALKY